MRTKVAGLVLALLVSSVLVGQQNKQAEVDLQAAIRSENVSGDPKAAIKRYEALVSKYARTNAATAAMALVRMADAYRRLGDGESRRTYERVIKDYPEQKEAVALAQAGLMGSGTSNRMNNTLVWSGAKVETVGRISPDGRYVTFTERETGDLAIHEFATGVDRPITDSMRPGQVFAEESAISKDGKRVAYIRFNNGKNELWLANLTGNPSPVRLYVNPDNFAWLVVVDWAPDGKSIAVVLMKDNTQQLGLVSVPDGSLRVLKSNYFEGARRVFFSPDGRWLGFDQPESSDRPERDVFVLSVDGSREVHAVDLPGHDEMVGWSPDGKWLLFSSDRGDSLDLWAVSFADGGTSGSLQPLKAGFDRSTPLGVTTSGALYYKQEKGGGEGTSRIQIATVDVATGKLTSPVELSRPYGDFDRNPRWSSDGKRLAYLSRRGPVGAKRDVLVVRSIETGQLREHPLRFNRVTLDGWVAGDRSLVVLDSEGQKMHFVDAETGEVRALNLGQFNGVAANPDFAPDGRSVLIVTQGRVATAEGRSGIYRVDLGTGEAVQVVPKPTQEINIVGPANWSADGKSFYYRVKSNNSVDYAIIERNLASGAERELFRRPYLLGPPRKAKDGQFVFTETVDPSTNSRLIRLIPTVAGESRELMRVPAEVRPEALNNAQLGQWSMAFPFGDGPLLVLKRLTDSLRSNMMVGKVPSELWLVPLSGEEPKKIGVTPPGFNSIIVSQDGRHVAFTVTDPAARPTTEIFSLENFLPKPEKK